MSPGDYVFVVAVILWALLGCIAAAGILDVVGAERIARWLRLDIGDER